MKLLVFDQGISVKYYGELPASSRGVGAGLNGDVPIGGFGRARPHRVDHDDHGTAALSGRTTFARQSEVTVIVEPPPRPLTEVMQRRLSTPLIASSSAVVTEHLTEAALAP